MTTCNGTTAAGKPCKRKAAGEFCTSHAPRPKYDAKVTLVADTSSFHTSLVAAVTRLGDDQIIRENRAYARLVRRLPREERPSHAEQGRLMAAAIRVAVEGEAA